MDNNTNNNNIPNPDFIDRKLDGVVKIFGLAHRDFMALMLSISILLNVYLVYEIITTSEDLHKQIVEEVRRQSPSLIKQETEQKLNPYLEKLDTAISKVNETLTTSPLNQPNE